MEEYKVVILAAGTGSRMKDFTKTFNKVLIPIQGKPTICHIIEKFLKDIEIVIAVGYKKESVMDYLSIAYPERKITFVEVDNFDKQGSGPGYSLLCCKNYLQCPFIQFAGDTLVAEEIPIPDKNWFGIAKVNNTERFCSVKVEKGRIVRIDDKMKTDNNFAFIGLGGVYNYKAFWAKLEKSKDLIKGEIQVSNGFRALIEEGLFPKNFKWFDTGTVESYEHASENYPNGDGYYGET